MTGFGRAAGPVGDGTGEVSARSVNHRALDLTVKVREADIALEPAVRGVFSRRLSRGKVDVTVRVKRSGSEGYDVSLNEALLEAILARWAVLVGKFPIAARLEARDLLSIPQVFSVENEAAEFSKEELTAVEHLAEEAASALIAMRETEGRGLASDLEARISRLQTRTRGLAARRDEVTRHIHQALRDRLKVLFGDVALDPGRLEQEAVLAADRSDISEELQRLEAHLEQFRELVTSPSAPVGKKLDFL